MDKPGNGGAGCRVRAAVRTVVEFSIHGEDLAPGGSQVGAMLDGGQAHRARQKTARERHEDYEAEVALSATVPGELVTLEITGRADGLFLRDGVLVVEEIKHSAHGAALADAWPEHWAQAACYGHMLCAGRDLPEVLLRVLYVDIRGEQVACFERRQDADCLANDFAALAMRYLAFLERQAHWRARRDQGIAALGFPFEGYRAGQREFAANAYIAIREKRRLLAQAPTGIGKTVAALFPALKALGEGLTAQIFYLTARTTGRALALDALAQLCEKGLPLRALEIMAKEKCCPREGGMHCDPLACKYAKGFFVRLDDALDDMCARESWRHEVVREVALAHEVCPFEFSLCLCEIADVVVCDYNYAFDPNARLIRVFQFRRDMTLLVDEAHHLVDRARDMLSAQMDSEALRLARRVWRTAQGSKNALYRAVTALMRALEAQRTEMVAHEDIPVDFVDLRGETEAFVHVAGDALGLSPGRELLDAFLMAQQYVSCLSRMDDAYIPLRERRGKEIALRLRCLDPAAYLKKCTEKLRGVVLFSATLSPLRGYARLLGVDIEADGLLALPSPFPAEHLRVVCRRASTRYAHRGDTAHAVAEAVAAMALAEPGNYLCMFPSYAYMRQIAELLPELLPGVDILIQQSGMDEAARTAFLDSFVPRDKTLLGLCVMGGAFAEGIDLPGDRLSGVAVVGIGLPQVCVEREALRDYYERKLGDGFAYAYRYPGITRVTQAVGRVIRTERDVGVAVLIDDRFLQSQVASLLPPGWHPLRVAGGGDQVREQLEAFWRAQVSGEPMG